MFLNDKIQLICRNVSMRHNLIADKLAVGSVLAVCWQCVGQYSVLASHGQCEPPSTINSVHWVAHTGECDANPLAFPNPLAFHCQAMCKICVV